MASDAETLGGGPTGAELDAYRATVSEMCWQQVDAGKLPITAVAAEIAKMMHYATGERLPRDEHVAPQTDVNVPIEAPAITTALMERTANS